MTKISLIVPVCNEELNLRPLYENCARTLEKEDYEMIFVDDGSRDGTLGILEDLSGKDRRVRVIQLSRNFGQTQAISAGLDSARGEFVVLMDGDGQNDPGDIPRLIGKIEEGYDLVSGWRRRRRDALLTRKLPSWIANRIVRMISGLPLHDLGCSLKAYRSSLIKKIKLHGEMHRFIPLYAYSLGARIAEVEVGHHPRQYGVSKYGISRSYKVILDLLTIELLSSSISRPSHFFGGTGMILSLLGVLAGADALVEKYFHGVWVHNNPVILLAVFLFLVGMQFISLGVLSEIIMRTYYGASGEKAYSVRKRIDPDGNDSES